MAKGHALLVGLKSVDPASYNGWDGTGGCWRGDRLLGFWQVWLDY